jgi:hypothetical protein
MEVGNKNLDGQKRGNEYGRGKCGVECSSVWWGLKNRGREEGGRSVEEMESEADKCQMQMDLDLDLDLDSRPAWSQSSIQPSPRANHNSSRLPPAPSFFQSAAFYFPFRRFISSFLLHPRPPTQITARVCPFPLPWRFRRVCRE